MNNVHKETLVAMKEGHRLPTKPSRDTLVRWCLIGCVNRATGKKHRLESTIEGGHRFTSLEAYDRWREKLNGGRDGA